MHDVASKSKPIAAASPGVIEPHALYTVEEARRRLRIGQWAWRRWRRDGLVVLRVSGRAFVSGRALIEFIEQQGGESAPND
jgi:hypothetical protein